MTRAERSRGAAVARAALIAVALLVTASLRAQEEITNTKLEMRPASPNIAAAIRDVTTRTGAMWIGYQVPMTADEPRRLCEARQPRAFLEPSPTFLVLVRYEHGQPLRVRTFTPECDIDGGGLPLVWLTGVQSNDSASWLASLAVAQTDTSRRPDSMATAVVTAIALHRPPASTEQLIRLARTSMNAEVRRQSVNWLTRSKDPAASTFLSDLLVH